MSVKVIAIGNCLMGNDGIGFRILESIDNCLKAHGIETFNGETDAEYCLSIINDNDFIFVLDAAILGGKPGEITIRSFDEYVFKANSYSQHLFSLLDLMHIYHKAVKGYVIGVEVENVNFSLDLSRNLEVLLNDISLNTLDNIIRRFPKSLLDLNQ